MRTIPALVQAAVALVAAAVSAQGVSPPVTIDYELTAFGSGHWRYEYHVTNLSLPEPIQEFTIWFDRSWYQNLVLATPDPPAAQWSELVVQPAISPGDDGFYDALATSVGIAVGEHVRGFAVEFDWLGVGIPGPQRYDIVDPVAFETRYSGFTVPEPAALILLAAGVLALAPQRQHHRRCAHGQ